ncbi:hypothetical protein AMAG_10771 [Allomyces macrogynus ATCC 38327]|uniref:Magnesium transporter n=1 Tax=Allomyces macrogynus (strain ATCC 38327) TaxID=578462 RepID=A0A0L0SRX0_ALLM3|nr:hypothetical protein AMAG_10771 [Allomyces macrogynus ATCC 38327]|eukprot:KNE65115.1 hypothetical protein AMAG_10771 [Allomyces macrogynus ATCC 38327]
MVVSPASPGTPPTPAAPPSSHHHDWDSTFRPPATEIVWKCTEFGPTGEVHQPSAPRTDSKRAFCRRNGLQLRDLRKLDPRDVDQYPAILARPGAIVVNLGHVRALIRRDSCTLFDAPSARANPARQALVDALSSRLAARAEKGKDATMPANEREEHLPYEWVVLETLFQSVLGSLQHDLRRLALPVNKIVNALVQGGTASAMSGAALDSLDQRRYLADLFVFVQRLSAFEQKVSNMRDVLRELLDNDEDMVDMCLSNDATLATADAATVEVDYDDLELLLETYLSNMEEVLDSTATLLQTVTSTERFITLSLDSQVRFVLCWCLDRARSDPHCIILATIAQRPSDPRNQIRHVRRCLHVRRPARESVRHELELGTRRAPDRVSRRLCGYGHLVRRRTWRGRVAHARRDQGNTQSPPTDARGSCGDRAAPSRRRCGAQAAAGPGARGPAAPRGARRLPRGARQAHSVGVRSGGESRAGQAQGQGARRRRTAHGRVPPAPCERDSDARRGGRGERRGHQCRPIDGGDAEFVARNERGRREASP